MGGEIPSQIDPRELVVQEGPDKGKVAAVEFSEGTNEDGTPHQIIEGLPRIGAEAEDKHRDEVPHGPAANAADLEGVRAMQGEIVERANNLDLARVSAEQKQEIGETAAAKFGKHRYEKAHEDQEKAKKILEELQNM